MSEFNFHFQSAFGGFVWGVFFSYVWGVLVSVINLLTEKALLCRKQRKKENNQ